MLLYNSSLATDPRSLLLWKGRCVLLLRPQLEELGCFSEPAGCRVSGPGMVHLPPRPWCQGALSSSTGHLGHLVIRKVLDILVLWSEFKDLGILPCPAFKSLGTAEDLGLGCSTPTFLNVRTESWGVVGAEKHRSGECDAAPQKSSHRPGELKVLGKSQSPCTDQLPDWLWMHCPALKVTGFLTGGGCRDNPKKKGSWLPGFDVLVE